MASVWSNEIPMDWMTKEKLNLKSRVSLDSLIDSGYLEVYTKTIPLTCARAPSALSPSGSLVSPVEKEKPSPREEPAQEPALPAPDLEAVKRLMPRFEQIRLKVPPNEHIVTGWVQRFGEAAILDVLARREDKLRGKHYQYLEPILLDWTPAAAVVDVPKRDTSADLRLDAIRDAARQMKRTAKTSSEARDYLDWLAPDGTLRPDPLTFDEWKTQAVNA